MSERKVLTLTVGEKRNKSDNRTLNLLYLLKRQAAGQCENAGCARTASDWPCIPFTAQPYIIPPLPSHTHKHPPSKFISNSSWPYQVAGTTCMNKICIDVSVPNMRNWYIWSIISTKYTLKMHVSRKNVSE